MLKPKECSECIFQYMRKSAYNYPEETRAYYNSCALMYIVDPAIRLKKMLDNNPEYCPMQELNVKEVSDEFILKVFRGTILRMYRNGRPSFKNMNPDMIYKVFNGRFVSVRSYKSLEILFKQNGILCNFEYDYIPNNKEGKEE